MRLPGSPGRSDRPGGTAPSGVTGSRGSMASCRAPAPGAGPAAVRRARLRNLSRIATGTPTSTSPTAVRTSTSARLITVRSAVTAWDSCTSRGLVLPPGALTSTLYRPRGRWVRTAVWSGPSGTVCAFPFGPVTVACLPAAEPNSASWAVTVRSWKAPVKVTCRSVSGRKPCRPASAISAPS